MKTKLTSVLTLSYTYKNFHSYQPKSFANRKIAYIFDLVIYYISYKPYPTNYLSLGHPG